MEIPIYFPMFPREVTLPRVPRPSTEPGRAPAHVSPAIQSIVDIGRSLARTRREQAREEGDTKPIPRVDLDVDRDLDRDDA